MSGETQKHKDNPALDDEDHYLNYRNVPYIYVKRVAIGQSLEIETLRERIQTLEADYERAATDFRNVNQAWNDEKSKVKDLTEQLANMTIERNGHKANAREAVIARDNLTKQLAASKNKVQRHKDMLAGICELNDDLTKQLSDTLTREAETQRKHDRWRDDLAKQLELISLEADFVEEHPQRTENHGRAVTELIRTIRAALPPQEKSYANKL